MGKTAFTWLGLMLFSLLAVSVEFYVAPGGDDANPGSREAPFATLERARDAARDTQAGQGVTVYLRAGVYPRAKTLTLTVRDSGLPEAPIIYRACEGEQVRISGGKEVAGFSPVTDEAILARLPEAARGAVLQANLKEQGITDFGRMTMRGFPQPIVPAPLELFFNNEPMTLARWPNQGFAVTGKIIDPGSVPRNLDTSNRPGTFVYQGDRPERWTQADDVWMFGYWCWDWADEYIGVARIDTENRQITLAAPHHYGLKEGMRYYALNLLEELDQPAEWYLDRNTGVLYFWPPGAMDGAEIAVSLLGQPMVSMREVSHVVFEGLTFECARGTAIQAVGGKQTTIRRCTFRNLGDLAVILGDGASDEAVVGLLGCSVFSRTYQDTVWNRHAGTGHRIEDCVLYNLGEGGIILGGGDRVALAPGNNSVLNTEIYNYSRSVTTNRPAIWIDGVGNRAVHNRIHHAPHTAIMFWGNDHLIEFNEFFQVCVETGDVGVIYTGRDWTMRGTTIRYNYIHDVHGPGRHGAQAIYLDDQASGTTAYGNVIVDVARAFLIGGGRDNMIENNVMVRCDESIRLDARGMGWAGDNQNIMTTRLAAVPYATEPWRTRYPILADILDQEPAVPKGNVVRNNVLQTCGTMNIDKHARQHGTVEANLVLEQDPRFIDPDAGDYRFEDDAPVFNLNPAFKRIPFEQIGRQ